MERVLVTGAGGFIGHHLVTSLKAARLLGPRRRPQGARVRADAMPTSSRSATCAAGTPACRPRAASTRSTRWRPTWAGWASSRAHHAEILHNNSLINLHTLEAAREQRRRALPLHLVRVHLPRVPAGRAPTSTPLTEEDAYPAQPQDALRLGEAGHRAALQVLPRGLRPRDAHRALPQHLRPARHLGRRPREGPGRHVPQGRHRQADRRPTIEIWGDGEQTRSFCYIDDCVEGIYRLMAPTTASR